MVELKSKRIIVAPLCWGLGHAARCIPIIRELLNENIVAIASDGEALDLLKHEFPELEFFELPGYNIRYTYRSMFWNMVIQAPKFLNIILKEKKRARCLTERWNANVLISDNRFGFRTPKTENIYITHQLKIPSRNRFISYFASKIHQNIIAKFDNCWVPDFKGKGNIAGKMSQIKINIPTTYLGPLSRMEANQEAKSFDYVAILSGPEPQRSNFEEKLLLIFKAFPEMRFCLIRGTLMERKVGFSEDHIQVFNLLSSKKLNQIINASETVICRSGYTSIMDLIHLQKPALLIPTPGQYEQEYLANRLNGKYHFQVIEQDKLSLSEIKRRKIIS